MDFPTQSEFNTQQRRNSMAQGAPVNPGIYLGRVANNLDPHRMGFCEVELISNSKAGSIPGERLEVVLARYTSPFAGQTNYASTAEEDKGYGNYAQSQTSYGFWAVPPDTGVMCIVCVVEGGDGEAFILSYMWDMYMNANMFNNMEANYNKKTVNNWEAAVDKHERGINNIVPTDNNTRKRKTMEDFSGITNHLELSATVTSGARRDTPSNVYGWSTPGHWAHWGPRNRNIYNQTVGKDENEYYRMRVGGSVILMDDGFVGYSRKTSPWYAHRDYSGTTPWNVSPDPGGNDSGETEGAILDSYLNEHMRLQTRTGHRIIMHNSEDFIHIRHANGMSWINMSSNGKIDVFAKDGVHIGTQSLEGSPEIDGQSQINLHGHQINIDCDEINMSAMRKIYIEQRKDLGIAAGTGRSSGEAVDNADQSPGGEGGDLHRGRGEIQFALEVVDGRLEIITTNGFGISTFEGDYEVGSDNIKNGNLKFHMHNRGDNFIAKSFPLDVPHEGEQVPEGVEGYKQPGKGLEGIGIGYSYQEVATKGLDLYDDIPGPFLELVGTHRSGNRSALEHGDLVLKAVLATNPPHEVAQEWNLVSGMEDVGGHGYWHTVPMVKYETAHNGLVHFYEDPNFYMLKTNLGRLPSGYPWKHEELNEPYKLVAPFTKWGETPEHNLSYSGLEVNESNYATPPEGYQSAMHVDCREYCIKGRGIF